MSLCINPFCPEPNHEGNINHRICQACGSELFLRKNPDPQKPNLVIEYQVKELLSAKTGFGIIYKVYEKDTPKILKVLKHTLNNHQKAVKLFKQEADVLSQLSHSGIPQVDGYFQHRTSRGEILHCLVMEYIDGVNLEEYLKQHNNDPISESQAIRWLKQIAEILDLLHNKEWFHRDIKPQNIMLRKDGKLVLIDFGTARYETTTYLAKLPEQEITAIVSLGYTPPEQSLGQAVPQSDFFALGRSFVHLLTAKHPVEIFNSYNNVFVWQPNFEISAKLVNLINDLMARNPNDRPANTEVLLKRIKKLEKKDDKRQIVEALLVGLMFAYTVLFVGNLVFTHKCFLFHICETPPPPKCPPDCGLTPTPTPIPTPTLTQEEPKIENGNVVYPYREGKDSQGRTAEFNIAILSSKYRWQIGHSDKVEETTLSGQSKTIQLSTLHTNLKQDQIFKIMENPNGIIAVGTASCEGTQLQEEARALARANKIRVVMGKLFAVNELHLLNLGQFKKDTCDKSPDITSFQRSILIIGIKKQTPGVILDEALHDRLSKNIRNFNLDDYSLFKLDDNSLTSKNKPSLP